MENAIYLPQIHNPIENFAVEEALFFEPSSYRTILMLWTNKPCVVIGRHQNPWREAHLHHLEEDGVPLIRRMSGGGTVYHDLGNLNFSFITSHTDYDESAYFRLIIGALGSLGIPLTLNGRKDLVYKNQKVSGNAFYLRGNRRLHHGTLLVDADKIALWRYLSHDMPSIVGKGISSTRSEVINLREVSEHVTTDSIKIAIQDMFQKMREPVALHEGNARGILNHDQMKIYEKARIRHATWAWQYGETPSFRYVFNPTSHAHVDGGYVTYRTDPSLIPPLPHIKFKEEPHVY